VFYFHHVDVTANQYYKCYWTAVCFRCINIFTDHLCTHCNVLAGNSGCGTDSSIYQVYLEYSIGDTSYLLTTLRYRGHHNGMLISVSNYISTGPHPLQTFTQFGCLHLLRLKVCSSHGHKPMVFKLTRQSGSWTMLPCCLPTKLIHHY